jgi:uncharacterized protein (TIGR03437 family)
MTRNLKRLSALIAVLLSLTALWLSTADRDVRAAAPPTFNKEVVRLFQKSCQGCHHPGDIAPFSLMTYKEARPWAKAIREAVVTRHMPPWKPVPGCGDFKDARQLTDAEIATIRDWVDAGAPEGEAADLPPALSFSDGWSLGEPDLILSYDSDYAPPLGKGDIYRAFPIPTNLRGDRYVSAIDVRPGNRKLVHHVIAYIDPEGVSAQLDANDPGPGYTAFGGPGFSNFGTLGGWAPGARPFFNPDGVATKLQQNARVVLQIHYSTAGASREGESDRTQVGIYFSRTPVRKTLNYLPLYNDKFEIPAGESRYKVTASFTTFPFVSGQIVSITPHMHLLGREMKVEMTAPGKPTTCLINIDDWSFHWQGTYNYQQPVAVPGGTRFDLTAYYDNSANNPRNPNTPPKPVRWGEQTTDEMCVAFVGFTLDAEAIAPSAPQLNDVGVDAGGNLFARGSGFLPGADVEINGRRLRDTQGEGANASSSLLSAEMWRVYAAPGQPVNVTVINPDGVRSAARTFTRLGAALSAAAVSAAHYSAQDPVTPDGIASVFGLNLATTTEINTTLPLPTKLAGTTVRVNGVAAPLFYVAPQQINFLIPSETQPGTAVIEVTNAVGTVSRGEILVASTAPGIFTANSRGDGAPAALATGDGVSYYAVGNPDGTSNPVQAGHHIVLYGTGFRRAPYDTVKVTIGGVNAPVHYAGAQPNFAGLDQLNTQVPAGLSGVVDLVLTVNGRAANVVKVRVK